MPTAFVKDYVAATTAESPIRHLHVCVGTQVTTPRWEAQNSERQFVNYTGPKKPLPCDVKNPFCYTRPTEKMPVISAATAEFLERFSSSDSSLSGHDDDDSDKEHPLSCRTDERYSGWGGGGSTYLQGEFHQTRTPDGKLIIQLGVSTRPDQIEQHFPQLFVRVLRAIEVERTSNGTEAKYVLDLFLYVYAPVEEYCNESNWRFDVPVLAKTVVEYLKYCEFRPGSRDHPYAATTYAEHVFPEEDYSLSFAVKEVLSGINHFIIHSPTRHKPLPVQMAFYDDLAAPLHITCINPASGESTETTTTTTVMYPFVKAGVYSVDSGDGQLYLIETQEALLAASPDEEEDEEEGDEEVLLVSSPASPTTDTRPAGNSTTRDKRNSEFEYDEPRPVKKPKDDVFV